MSEETIFHEALAKPAAERTAFLDAATAGNPKLRAAVESLLSAHEASGNMLDQPPLEVSLAGDSVARLDTISTFKDGNGPETVIANRYTLLEKIGEGGMGEVWVAKQTEPVKRKVALKLIKKGMDSKVVLSRFEQERQALGMMDHPNIARVLDGGLTPTGQPFFVMELVNGLPLNKFCDEAKLTPRERLELFVPICQAIQHAHQKGIVHRDLKPANILVTLIDGKGVPKVIDFGVAKATHGKLTEESMNTQFGAVVGTLEYMAPEQAGYAGEDIDTRADIYSLGVILYELLTGLKPIDAKRLKNTALLEMIRVIKEVEPAKPSTRFSTAKSMRSLAALRKTEPSKLMAMLRGELDWVVMKCLEKSRDRRYETANGLARDIQRYLADQPVEARPASAVYRIQKFIHRNPLQLALAGMVALLLLGGAAVVWWQSGQAGARREADLRRQLQDEQRASADAARLARNSEAVLALLEQCQKALEASDADKSAVILEAAKKRSAEGGAEKEADRLKRLDADLTLLRDLDAVDQFCWTWTENRFPDSAIVASRTREALKRFGADPDTVSVDDAAARVSASFVRPRIVTAVDRLLMEQKTAGVRALLRKVDADAYRDAVRDAVFTDDTAKMAELAGQKAALEQPPGFAAFLGQSGAISEERRRQVLQTAITRRPNDLYLLINLGNSYTSNQKDEVDERLRWFQAAIAAAPANVAAHNNLGVAIMDKGRWDEAIAWFKKAIEIDPKFAMGHNNLGDVLRDKGQFDEAIACYRKAIELDPADATIHNSLGAILCDVKRDFNAAIACFRKAIELDPKLAWAHKNLGAALHNKGQFDEAIACFRKAIELDPKFAKAYCNLGSVLRDKGQFGEAIACFKKAIELDPKDADAHYGLGSLLCDEKQDFDEAIACFRKAIEFDPKLASAHKSLGIALQQKGQFDEAIACYRKAIELDPKFARAYTDLGCALRDKGQVDEAISCHRKAIELDPADAVAYSNLGAILCDVKRDFDAAIFCFRKAIELKPNVALPHANLGNALDGKGQLDEAVACYRKAIELDPKLIQAHGNLGNALFSKGQLDEAIVCYRKVVELDPKNARAHNGLGSALHGKGRFDEAIACYRKAIELDPANAVAHYSLGALLCDVKRDYDAAIACFRKALEIDPTDADAQESLGIALRKKLKVAIQDKLPAYLKSEFQPTTNDERLALAEVCGDKKLYHAAAGLYAAAFAVDPKVADDLKAFYRYNAACYAALAAAGQGDAANVDDKERTRLRKQSLDWLRADLALRTKQLESGQPADRAEARKALLHWQKDADLAGIRDAAALAKLPPEEQKTFTQLWADVAALLK